MKDHTDIIARACCTTS